MSARPRRSTRSRTRSTSTASTRSSSRRCPSRVSRWLSSTSRASSTASASGHDRHRHGRRTRVDLAWGVTPVPLWMQVLIVLCVIASAIIAIVKALSPSRRSRPAAWQRRPRWSGSPSSTRAGPASVSHVPARRGPAARAEAAKPAQPGAAPVGVVGVGGDDVHEAVAPAAPPYAAHGPAELAGQGSGGDLPEHARVDQPLEPLGCAQEGRAALGVGEQHGAALEQLQDQRLEVAGHRGDGRSTSR